MRGCLALLGDTLQDQGQIGDTLVIVLQSSPSSGKVFKKSYDR
jgi:hypothetical protein